MNGRGDLARAALTGGGFALGFGWLFFPALAEGWLGSVLWGSAVKSGAGLFLLLTALGFFGVFAFTLRLKRGRSLRPLQWTGAVHLTSLAFLVAALILARTKLWPYGSALLLAPPAVLQGLFWAERLLALPPNQAGRAFALAALTAAALSVLAFSLSLPWRTALWPLCLLAGWFVDRKTSPRAAPPKNRGGTNKVLPTEKAGEAESAPLPTALTIAAVLIIPLLAFSSTPPTWPWLGALIIAAGAAMEPLFTGRLGFWGSFALALALDGAGALVPVPLVGGLTSGLAEGLAVAAILRLLAGRIAAFERAALGLGLLLVLGNLGAEAAALWPAAGGPLLMIVALGFFTLEKRSRRTIAAPEDVVEKDENEPQPTPLTARELEILELVRQGWSNSQIAETLGVQEVTVRFHLRNIYKKSGIVGRKQLAAPVGLPAEMEAEQSPVGTPEARPGKTI